METIQSALTRRLQDRSARIAIVGLGYVGLPLATVFAEAGFTVTGIDLDARKVSSLCRGESYVHDVPSEQVQRLVSSGKLSAAVSVTTRTQ